MADRTSSRRLALRWGGIRYALIAYAMPLTYAAVAYGLIWILGLGKFADAPLLSSLAEKLGWRIQSPALLITLYLLLMGTTQMITAVARALGEEIGWRGFLAPLLVARLGFTGGSVVTGIIWAAWHMPLVFYAGYNGGTPLWFSISCFCAMVIGLSIILTWLRLASMTFTKRRRGARYLPEPT